MIDQRHASGPFDIIGDVHGCADELEALLTKLGYRQISGGWQHAAGIGGVSRRAVFVGDLVDRGPRSPDVLRIVIGMVSIGSALAIPGNHDDKFCRWLEGRNVEIKHGLGQTVAQMADESAAFRNAVGAFLRSLPVHLWLDGGGLVVTHAGIRPEMFGVTSPRVRSFCLYGDTGQGLDKHGLPIRYDWAAGYRGETAIIYGHTIVRAAEWHNNTLCIDTGAVFGGALTALRWPERELVSVPAVRAYAETERWGLPPPRL